MFRLRFQMKGEGNFHNQHITKNKSPISGVGGVTNDQKHPHEVENKGKSKKKKLTRNSEEDVVITGSKKEGSIFSISGASK